MPPTFLFDAAVLIIDDEIANVRLLEIILQQAGFTNVSSTTDSREAARFFDRIRPDAVLLDLMMPHVDGFHVMAHILSTLPPESYLPILVMTADPALSVRQRALALGAKDFLTKPLDETEVVLRLRNLLEVRVRHHFLESGVRDRTLDLEATQREMLQRHARTAEYRDDATGTHTKRVGAMAGCLALNLGMSEGDAEVLQDAATLHDIGKIAIPDSILLKPGRLTPEEFAIMRTHTTVGACILSGSVSPWLRLAEEIALTHHERWDGGGYEGMRGADIPLSGRIVGLVDVFDALTHVRPYKEAWPLECAIQEVRSQSGRHFDPQVVDAFLEMARQGYFDGGALKIAA